MTTAAHVWPPYVPRGGGVLPSSARILTGTLIVPDYLPAGVLAYMEQRFRSILWPPCRKDGYVRWGREFVWEANGRVLHYRIIDV